MHVRLRPAGVVLLLGSSALMAEAQAPGLLWSTNVHARLFAVDEQTNAYANDGGKVITVNGQGVPVQTNAICPLPGRARRDAAGNFYFGGEYDMPQDFGGIILQPTMGYPDIFVVKYAANGALQRAARCGSYNNRLTDLLPDGSGGCYAAWYSINQGGNAITHVNTSGAQQWNQGVPIPSSAYDTFCALGGLTGSGFSYYVMNLHPSFALHDAGRVDPAGDISRLSSDLLLASTLLATNSTPVVDELGRLFRVGRAMIDIYGTPGSNVLQKFARLLSAARPFTRWMDRRRALGQHTIRGHSRSNTARSCARLDIPRISSRLRRLTPSTLWCWSATRSRRRLPAAAA